MTRPVITLGMRLALARKAAGLTPAQMAAITGYTKESISRYENDKLPVPPAVLYVYQHECNVSRDFIEGREELLQVMSTNRWESQLPLFQLRAAS